MKMDPKIDDKPKMDPKMKMGDVKDPHAGHGGATKTVPGFPQSMAGMSMYSENEIKKLNSKWQTRGMRKEWFEGVEGLMTVVRVLPSELYDRVAAGKDVPPGASVPGAAPGKAGGHEGHRGGAKAEPASKMHEGHNKD